MIDIPSQNPDVIIKQGGIQLGTPQRQKYSFIDLVKNRDKDVITVMVSVVATSVSEAKSLALVELAA
jgi:hypothetical protein